jgi:hypothetical protein
MTGGDDETPVAIARPAVDRTRPCPVCGDTPVDQDGDVCPICLDADTRSRDQRTGLSGWLGSAFLKRRSRRTRSEVS